MSALSAWFLKGAKLHTLWWWVPLILIGHICYLVAVYPWVAETFPENLSSSTGDILEYIKELGLFDTIGILSLVMLMEELIFRAIPFSVATVLLWWLIRKSHLSITLVVMTAVAVASSYVFGLVHGGVGNIFIQGVAGLLMSFVYLRWGRLGFDPGKGLWAAFVLHAANNGSFVAIGMIAERL